jgi:hypothetical protein
LRNESADHLVEQFEQGLRHAKITGHRKKEWKTAIAAALRIIAPPENEYAV